MSRSTYNISQSVIIGIDEKKLNKFTITAAGAITYAAAGVSDAGRISIATMPVIGLTCIKSGVRVYQFY